MQESDRLSPKSSYIWVLLFCKLRTISSKLITIDVTYVFIHQTEFKTEGFK